MTDRFDKMAYELRQDIKDINEKISDVKVSLQDLKSKQHFGMFLLKSAITIGFGLVGGLLGVHFHGPKMFK